MEISCLCIRKKPTKMLPTELVEKHSKSHLLIPKKGPAPASTVSEMSDQSAPVQFKVEPWQPVHRAPASQCLCL